MKFGITTVMSCTPSTEVELPIKDWKEVKEWFVKWDKLHYTLDGKNWEEVELDNDADIEWKRPVSVKIYNPETYDAIAEQD